MNTSQVDLEPYEYYYDYAVEAGPTRRPKE